MNISQIDLILNKDTEYVFLIGAGASVASHIHDGAAICKEILANTLIDFCFEENVLSYENRIRVFEGLVQEFLDQGMTKYQAIMCSVRNSKDESWIARYIRKLILENARRPKPDNRWIINNCYNTIANIISKKILAKTRFASVIATTNFDPLMYYAFIQNWDTEPVLIRSYNELLSMQPEQVRDFFPCLMFLHGYWHNHQLYNDPQQFENHREKWIHALSSNWVKNDIIVIGYSGLEDNIAQKWLAACLKEGRTVWWCLYRPKNETVRNSKTAFNLDAIFEKCLTAYDKENPKKKKNIRKRKREIQEKYREWMRKWDLVRVLSDDDEKREIKRRLEHTGNNLRFINIESADSFALELGAKMGISEVRDVRSVVEVFPWFYPNDVSKFENGAEVSFESVIDDKGMTEFEIDFRMGNDAFPGNNHGGVNIDSVEHEVNLGQLGKNSKYIRVYYSIVEADIKNNFSEIANAIEFKLHSRVSAWSYLVPIVQNGSSYHDIPLQEYADNGVDLTSVWRLVIAADVKGLGKNGHTKIRISRTELIAYS